MRMTTIKIQDTTFAGQILNEIALSFSTEFITVHDLIDARVRFEIADYIQRAPTYFKGLIEPTEAERSLNGTRIKPTKPIDPEKQVLEALAAFQRNGFFILVDDSQVTSLDETVLLTAETVVSFIKLTQLVGG